MKFYLLITAITISALYASQSDAKGGAHGYCNPERSKPCGAACIPLYRTCRTSWTIMKSGVNPNGSSSKPAFDNPKLVNEIPKN